MGVQGDRIFAAITEKGFPDPWAAFGECLSWEAAYAVQLKHAIDQARKDTDEQTRAALDLVPSIESGHAREDQVAFYGALLERDDPNLLEACITSCLVNRRPVNLRGDPVRAA